MSAQPNKQMSKQEFIALVDKHRDEFYRYIMRQTWDRQQADDVFSASVLAAYENLHKFEAGTNFRAWMYRIITNKCFVANRHTSRAMESLDNSTAEAVEQPSADEYGDVLAEPERVMEAVGDEVVEAFKRLSDAERSCILLRGVEKLSYKEIAEVLGIPAGTVMTHLSRGRAKLRKELADYARGHGIVKAGSNRGEG